MTELIKEVKRMVSQELVRANQEHPMFRSDHEGLAIIGEEVWEAKREAERLKAAYRLYRYDTYTDEEQWCKNERVNKLEAVAIELAAEAIQVAAMCRKYKMSHEMDVPQEYVNYMADTCPESEDGTIEDIKEALENLQARPEVIGATIIDDDVIVTVTKREEDKDA